MVKNMSCLQNGGPVEFPGLQQLLATENNKEEKQVDFHVFIQI